MERLFELKIAGALLEAMAASGSVAAGPEVGVQQPRLEGWSLIDARWTAHAGDSAVMVLELERATSATSVTIFLSDVTEWAGDGEVLSLGATPEEAIAELLLIHLSEYLSGPDGPSEIVLP